MRKPDYDTLLEELNLAELGELCPNDSHKHRLLEWTLGLYQSDTGFSPELKRFVRDYEVVVGAQLKRSPISLKKEPSPNKLEDTEMQKSEPLNGAIAAEVVVILPELISELDEDGTVTLTWDAEDETLILGEAKPKKKKKRKKDDDDEDETPRRKKKKGKKVVEEEEDDGDDDDDEEEETPKKKKGKKGKKKKVVEEDDEDDEEEDEGEGENMSYPEFKKSLKKELKDTDDLAEFAKEMSVKWKKSGNAQVNRMRIIAAIREACGWEDEGE